MRLALFLLLLFYTDLCYACKTKYVEGYILTGIGDPLEEKSGRIKIEVVKGANAVRQYKKKIQLSEKYESYSVSGTLRYPDEYTFSRTIEKIPLGLYGGG